jgi:ammonia channel protein AmtB
LNFEDREIKKIMKHIKGDYQDAFKIWMQNQANEFRPHNQAYIVMGTLLLWVCWLFFNGGSAPIFSMRKNGPAKVIMNCVLAASGGGLVAVFLKPRLCK